jgi:16S rRNA (cytosine967-C5)-methyltransferase
LNGNTGGGKKPTSRAVAAGILLAVIGDGKSLTGQLKQQLPGLKVDADHALIQELCYGVLRWYPRLQGLSEILLSRPFKQRDQIVHMLILVGFYQLLYLDKPAHAVIHETVEAARALGKDWATGVVNAVLRNCQRKMQALQQQLDSKPVTRWSHPNWFLKQLRQDWPTEWEAIVDANNQRPPMMLRVNLLRQSVEDYAGLLTQQGVMSQPVAGVQSALCLPQAVGVDKLPGFAQGCVSVQDAGAQLAADILSVQAGERVLDACAAPGGKTCHLLESRPACGEVVALDIDANRLERIQENLDRLQLPATLLEADASETGKWWDGNYFDRILLDAPCSASGVIRRHPDIKVLRRVTDIEQLAKQQKRLLDALWLLLAPGGMLLYVTCSILPRENTDQMKRFILSHPDCKEVKIDREWGRALAVGRQILPGENGMDGFYYACLIKSSLAGLND